jgi:hypothetical protein
MKRIFVVLAAVSFLALVATFLVGVLSWWQGAAAAGSVVYTVHFCLGLFSVILGPLAVHCLIFIYFLGTGRWVKEVAISYQLPDDPWPKQTRDLKRRTFPVALLAMLVAIATSAAGQGAQMRLVSWHLHATLAVATLIVNLWAYVVEYRNVTINGQVIDAVYAEVDRIRAAYGLPSSAEALQQEQG